MKAGLESLKIAFQALYWSFFVGKQIALKKLTERFVGDLLVVMSCLCGLNVPLIFWRAYAGGSLFTVRFIFRRTTLGWIHF